MWVELVEETLVVVVVVDERLVVESELEFTLVPPSVSMVKLKDMVPSCGRKVVLWCRL